MNFYINNTPFEIDEMAPSKVLLKMVRKSERGSDVKSHQKRQKVYEVVKGIHEGKHVLASISGIPILDDNYDQYYIVEEGNLIAILKKAEE